MRESKIAQADGKSSRGNGGHQYLKRRKRRLERRRAKKDPEALPAYNKFSGYEM